LCRNVGFFDRNIGFFREQLRALCSEMPNLLVFVIFLRRRDLFSAGI
jgi:hypothetical protein